MRNSWLSYGLALGGVAVVAAVTALWLPLLAGASAALLFLLPVLFASTRGGVGPGLLAAGAGAIAYNFFLLPPRFTLHIHGFDNLISVVVLFAVALVTARLATALQAREADASARAAASDEAAETARLLGRGSPDEAIAAAIDRIGARYGQMEIMSLASLDEHTHALSALDRSAAIWAINDGDITGHGTQIMPAADWTYIPICARGAACSDVAAIARPSNGRTRSGADIAQLQALARLVGQARDQAALMDERQSRLRLEDREALRQTMLASLAHDFRTPLTVLTGEIAGIQGGGEAVARAMAQAHRLDRMMDDLIGIARIESGLVHAQMEAIDLIDSVDDACATARQHAGDVTLSMALPGDLPLVTADPVLLRHILANLIDNAIRHATASVSVGARRIAESVVVTVSDDGTGIAHEDRERIFERFEQGDIGDRRGGTGLGLAIVRGFADAMAMAVSIDDSAAGGAAFHLTMPARETGQ